MQARVDQFAASLSSAKNSYDQYTTSRTRSHEYSEMASRTESLTGQMSENLTQQFANFVQHRAPQDAEAILTNTSSPEIAAQREMLAREFVKAQVEPRIDSSFEQGRNDIGNGMASVSGTPVTKLLLAILASTVVILSQCHEILVLKRT